MKPARIPNVSARLVNAGASMYRHPAGFALLIPSSVAFCPEGKISIGKHTLSLDYRRKTLSGFVPPSWLVDLNADSACTKENFE